MGYNPLIDGVYWVTTHLLTIDPNFQRDIPVGYMIGSPNIYIKPDLKCSVLKTPTKNKEELSLFVEFYLVISTHLKTTSHY